jgi:tRNA(Ile2) C34 agmatinyltransferase TiaS
MSQSENIFDPARLVLDLPICPRCGARMWLSRIEPDEPGHDKRTFECPKCENVVSGTFKYR